MTRKRFFDWLGGGCSIAVGVVLMLLSKRPAPASPDIQLFLAGCLLYWLGVSVLTRALKDR